jgi:hypothetical protein
MTQRAEQLHGTADRQIADLIAVISTLDDAAGRLPCPGREKLGDGTVAACAQHTADNYERIAAFIQTSDRMSGAHQPPQHGRHDDQHAADNVDLHALLEQLSVTRKALSRLAELTDSQLDAIPPAGGFRFCDGQRTLEKVLASLLKHQSHQVDTVNAVTGYKSAARDPRAPI